jgi:hypothetical protein
MDSDRPKRRPIARSLVGLSTSFALVLASTIVAYAVPNKPIDQPTPFVMPTAASTGRQEQVPHRVTTASVKKAVVRKSAP